MKHIVIDNIQLIVWIDILYIDADRVKLPVKLVKSNVDGVISIDDSIPTPSVDINIFLASPMENSCGRRGNSNNKRAEYVQSKSC